MVECPEFRAPIYDSFNGRRELLHSQSNTLNYAPPHANDEPPDAALGALVCEIIGRVADKWAMLILELLAEHVRLRFTRLGRLVGGISQKMLTQTLRNMEADDLVTRTVFPIVLPRVEYERMS
jgi:DNA-binding HxlR family transcriptional regulator